MRMSYIDTRYLLAIVINMLKSEDWEWDPFNIYGDHVVATLYHRRHSTFWLVLRDAIIAILCLFTSLDLLLLLGTSPNPDVGGGAHIGLRLGAFSGTVAVSLLASLLVPQSLFWYAYPLILFISSRSAWLFINHFSCFLKALVAYMCTTTTAVPLCHLLINLSFFTRDHDHDHHHQQPPQNNLLPSQVDHHHVIEVTNDLQPDDHGASYP